MNDQLEMFDERDIYSTRHQPHTARTGDWIWLIGRAVVALLVVLMLIASIQSAEADETSDAIRQGAAPVQVMPCIEHSTQKAGLCGLFKMNEDADTYVAFRVQGVIQWIKRLKNGKAVTVYNINWTSA